MQKGGIEPPRVSSHAPQTCASTNSATSAQKSDIRASYKLPKTSRLRQTKRALLLRWRLLPLRACCWRWRSVCRRRRRGVRVSGRSVSVRRCLTLCGRHGSGAGYGCCRRSLRLRRFVSRTLNHRARPGDERQRERQSGEHESSRRADGKLCQQSLRAAWPESRARNAARKKRARVSLTRLQQHRDDEHYARQNKNCI